jgi:hypothetical protein
MRPRIGWTWIVRYDSPDQDLDRPGVVLERRAGKMRVAIEVALPADFCPGRVNSERDDRQQNVDDPYAEIFARVAGKSERLAPNGYSWLVGRSYRIHEITTIPFWQRLLISRRAAVSQGGFPSCNIHVTDRRQS